MYFFDKELLTKIRQHTIVDMYFQIKKLYIWWSLVLEKKPGSSVKFERILISTNKTLTASVGK